MLNEKDQQNNQIIYKSKKNSLKKIFWEKNLLGIINILVIIEFPLCLENNYENGIY